MNQTQREYLINQVTRTSNSQIEELEKQRPKQPSLNNYLIAAFLDNTIKFADIQALQEKIHERVLDFGNNDVLIEEDDDDYGWKRRKKKRDDEKINYVKLIAEDLFIIPEVYKQKYEEYITKNAEIDKKISEIRAIANTIEMKIQIGSSATMDKLVMQIDNMGDLNLVNTQLMLGDGK